jgi:dolichyl-phosphate beta-glucosyltransferase
MSDVPIDLSVIIPAYMEAEVIESTLQQLAKFLATRDYGNVEVVVVVPDSSDGTGELAASQAHLFKNFRIVKPGPRVGKGRDVRAGIFEARGKYKLFMDADLATPLHHIDEVKTRIMDTHAPVGIATRDLVSTHKTFVRKIMTRGGNLLIQLLLLPGLKDTQCGFKVFEATAAEEIFSRMTILGWGFDMEILAIARKLGYHITTFETPDWRDPKADGDGLTGDSASKTAVSTLEDLAIVRLRMWAGRYKKPSYVHKSLFS